jgi:hypothetical protein
MRKLLVILFVSIFLFPIASNADTNTKRKTVEQLMVSMKVDKMLDSMYSQMDQMFVGMAQELGVKESERQIFDKFMSNVAKAMKEEMTWDKLKEPMIDIYLKHYSEKEINDMLAFYNSESGKTIIDKMPLVTKESMQISQQLFKGFLPRLKMLSDELQKELQQARTDTQ